MQVSERDVAGSVDGRCIRCRGAPSNVSVPQVRVTYCWSSDAARGLMMPRGCQLSPLVLTEERREQLTCLSLCTSMPHGLVHRARIVLACAEGLINVAVAERLGASRSAVGKWR